MRRYLTTLVLGVVLALPASAEDFGLLIVGRNYDRLADLRASTEITKAEGTLEAAGFRVVTLQDATASELRASLASYVSDMAAADRLVVMIAGHVVNDGRNSWLLGKGARTPDAFAAGAAGLPLRPLFDIAGEKPGAAVIALVDSASNIRLGRGLEQGYVASDIPQGVTVVTGPASALTAFIQSQVLQPGTAIGAALQDASDRISGYGYLPRSAPFLPDVPEETATSEDPADLAFWARMSRLDTPEAYDSYLDRYPQGQFAQEAQTRRDAMQRSPEQIAADAEQALALSRDARREIQRNLSILGYDPRGIDGVFGPGTRGAIRTWQGASDLDATGYLTGNQISRLQVSAAIRARELEEEAARRQEEQDRQDSAFWRDTGRGETEAGLRSYLERYPDGLFAEVARDRLGAIEEQSRASAEQADRDFWERVRTADTAEAYRAYLREFPRGAFADEAQARLALLERANSQEDATAAARAEEARVLANPITRLLVERRLQQLGFDVGAADGRLDDQTRRAIRRYQRSRDLEVTGYVTQQTMVRILAGGG